MALLAVGDKAPAFQTTDQDGKPVSLSDFKGQQRRPLLLPEGRHARAAPRKRARSATAGRKFRKRKIAVLGVSVDDEKSHKKFAEKFSLPFPLLADTDKAIVKAYGVWGEKNMYGRKYMGTHRVTYLIDEKGRIAAVWPKVKPDGHADEILERSGGSRLEGPSAAPRGRRAS